MTPQSGYALGLLSATAIHAALLFGFGPGENLTPPEFGIEAAPPGVEVTLVAALPAEEPAAAEPEQAPEAPEEVPPLEPEPIPETISEPTPAPIPELPAPPTEPELVEPSPPPPSPAPSHPSPPQPTKRVTPKPSKAAVSGDGGSARPGNDAITANASSGGFSAQAGYLRNPHPAYPEEARRAGQQGVVLLKVAVNERGRVTAVTVARSSGHPLLDERASSTVRERWVFKPARRGNTPVPAEVTVPVRFTLENR